jgi:hypothetical protein
MPTLTPVAIDFFAGPINFFFSNLGQMRHMRTDKAIREAGGPAVA